jgi:hypothetical protein
MRITIVSDADLVNSNYRSYQPMQVLSRKGHQVRHNKLGDPRFRPAELLASDVVHIHRYMDGEMFSMVQRLGEAGVAVVWDNDDDVAAVPKQNPNYKTYGGARRREMLIGLSRMVQLVDVVTTPSPLLAEGFRALGGRDVRVVENFLPREFSGIRPRDHDGVVIGWVAGLEHQLDYQQLRLRETLRRLLDRHPDLRVKSIGLGLGLPSDRYDHVSEAPFLELGRHAAGYDIGIAPLADIPFNRARSNVKLKEYAVAGAPWLASPVGAYVGMGEEQGGRLVADDRWEQELERLISSARERRKLAKRAAKWGKRQGIEQNIGVWEAVFHDAIARARSRGSAVRPPAVPA